jgi:hypothetical protein
MSQKGTDARLGWLEGSVAQDKAKGRQWPAFRDPKPY